MGKLNGARYYEFIEGKPQDGSSPGRDANFLAVHEGVKAIQHRIAKLGFYVNPDGTFGPNTRDAVKAAQHKLNLYVDGVVGPKTAKALWHDLIAYISGAASVPANHMAAIMLVESLGDPGAVGYSTPSDHGLFQINLDAHKDITVQQAHDPEFAISYTAKRLHDARAKFLNKGATLQTACSIAQHNAPAWAQQWYDLGTPPNATIKAYVDKVLFEASNWK